MVINWPFLKTYIFNFYSSKIEKNLSKQFVIYYIDFDPIDPRIETSLTAQDDHQHLNFMKDMYVCSWQNMATNYCKIAKCKSCPFHLESESTSGYDLLRVLTTKQLEDSEFYFLK